MSATRTRKTGLSVRAQQAQDTREKILRAAIKVFARHGYEGARIERISSLAKSHDRMIYYYFGSKEKLFVAVLEEIYLQLNEAEKSLDLSLDEPAIALTQIADFVWNYYLEHPELVWILNSENVSQGKHAKRSSNIREISNYALSVLETVLEQGKQKGVFRAEARARDVYIIIASLGYFYNSNHHTLSAFLGEPLMGEAALEHWRGVIRHTVLNAVQVNGVVPQEAAPLRGRQKAKR